MLVIGLAYKLDQDMWVGGWMDFLFLFFAEFVLVDASSTHF